MWKVSGYHILDSNWIVITRWRELKVENLKVLKIEIVITHRRMTHLDQISTFIRHFYLRIQSRYLGIPPRNLGIQFIRFLRIQSRNHRIQSRYLGIQPRNLRIHPRYLGIQSRFIGIQSKYIEIHLSGSHTTFFFKTPRESVQNFGTSAIAAFDYS